MDTILAKKWRSRCKHGLLRGVFSLWFEVYTRNLSLRLNAVPGCARGQAIQLWHSVTSRGSWAPRKREGRIGPLTGDAIHGFWVALKAV